MPLTTEQKVEHLHQIYNTLQLLRDKNPEIIPSISSVKELLTDIVGEEQQQLCTREWNRSARIHHPLHRRRYKPTEQESVQDELTQLQLKILIAGLWGGTATAINYSDDWGRKYENFLQWEFCLWHEIFGTQEILTMSIDQFYVKLFWSTWIDQVMYSVSTRDVYWEFRKRFPFPKILNCNGGRPRAGEFIVDRIAYNDINLLLYKERYWGSVERWLMENGYEDIRERALNEFRQSTRVPDEIKYLFEN